ncbi:PREDICTED: arylsulfatase B-like [Polistes canadensis]|uniref:arylsulfatase B-like n=1 Tax=Polistes canadensis TaxID=91411 RepID=UPI000718B344|nr:PREDICTED: arylsulfatase B-like [Polistes canadensis]
MRQADFVPTKLLEDAIFKRWTSVPSNFITNLVVNFESGLTPFLELIKKEMNEKWMSLAPLFVTLCLSSVFKLNYAIFLSKSTLHQTISKSRDDIEKEENQEKEFHRDNRQKPNIIMIIADDMGWNDVGFHGSDQIPTPNIDALAYNGVILNSHYVLPLCTPSRVALMTGKYPIRLGMQHSVLLAGEPRGLPLNEKLLPQYLKEADYVTHAVGKWHLGFYKKVYTPTYRGFDTFFGYYTGFQDYYTHLASDLDDKLGFDMRRNLSVAWDTLNKYSTDLFTEESVRLINSHNTKNPMFLYLSHLAPHNGGFKNSIQAPDEEIAKFGYIHDPERRTYAAMVSKLDESVGKVIAALRKRGMLENSIILFISDNGAPTINVFSNHGSNYPLRGIKETPWEGAVRGVAAIWSPFINKSKRVSNQLMTIVDWLPTLLSAAGLNKSKLNKIDGKDLWENIVENRNSPRTEILINIDDISDYAAIRYKNFKYITGNVGVDDWLGESGKPSEEFGFPPAYNPNQILQSKAGIALAGVMTTREIIESRRKRRNVSVANDTKKEFQKKILTADQLLDLRKKAELKCNVKKEDIIKCDTLRAPCLFNIVNDPCEMINLAESKPQILALLELAILKHRFTVVQPSNQKKDILGNPLLYNNTWISWGEIENTSKNMAYLQKQDSNEYSSLLITMIFMIFVLFILGIINLLVLLSEKLCKKKETKNRKDSKNKDCSTTVKIANEIENNIRNSEDEENTDLINPTIIKDSNIIK